MARKTRMRVALAAWEIGRAPSGFGAQAGGLGVIVEELPPALLLAANELGIALEVDTLSPCFGHYDRDELRPLDVTLPVSIEGHRFSFQAFERVFTEVVPFRDRRGRERRTTVKLRMVYFWDEGQLHWTRADALYASDPWRGLCTYAAVCQAMAAYLAAEAELGRGYDTVHLHDYHVGLTPFYLDHALLETLPFHMTVHNATYQGVAPIPGDPVSALAALGLPADDTLFRDYFDFFGALNPMRACLRRIHELGGRVTTVSGDLDGRTGYAGELRRSHGELLAEAARQKGAPPIEVFVPNRYLDLFEKLPIAGITNGLSPNNRPENLSELCAATVRAALTARQAREGPSARVFEDEHVQATRLAEDFDFDADRLGRKARLKTLLHRECFGWDGDKEGERAPILFCMVGRLVDQKNFEIVLRCLPDLFAHAPEARLIVLASAPDGPDRAPREGAFFAARDAWPGRVFFSNVWNPLLAKMILAGSDFTVIPSKFEPCGLVDYEAALLGTVVIARRTGGLAKMDGLGYLYDWLDCGDPAGEAAALLAVLCHAVDVYRHDPEGHGERIRRSMAVDAAWDRSARQYVELYRFGQLMQSWRRKRHALVRDFAASHTASEALRFFLRRARGEYRDPLDEMLLALLGD